MFSKVALFPLPYISRKYKFLSKHQWYFTLRSPKYSTYCYYSLFPRFSSKLILAKKQNLKNWFYWKGFSCIHEKGISIVLFSLLYALMYWCTMRTYVVQYLTKVHQVCSFLVCKRCVIGIYSNTSAYMFGKLVVKCFRFIFVNCVVYSCQI